jgi:tetratricopeptide (TPR) repeat protein
MLPGKALALISVFGVRGDSQVGAENLRKSWEGNWMQVFILLGNGVRSPLAAMIILNFYQMKSSFVPHIYNPLVIPDAKKLIAECAERHPKSAIHLLLAGRILRCEKNTESSKQMFKRAYEAQNYWRELRLFAQYELGLTCTFELDWAGAAKYMETLYEASYWSKAFYAYFYAVCLDTYASTTDNPEERQSNKAKAIELYEKIPSLVARKYGGRTLAVEQYVLRKCKIYQKHDYKHTFLPILELMGVWNAFGFMHSSVLTKLKPFVEGAIQQIQQLAKQDVFTENESIERAAPLRLVLGVIHRELKEYAQAEKEFETILSIDYKTEKMVSPFAQYEYGIMEYLRNNKKQAKKRFQKAREAYKDYNFEIRLDFRIHLANMQLSQEGF